MSLFCITVQHLPGPSRWRGRSTRRCSGCSSSCRSRAGTRTGQRPQAGARARRPGSAAANLAPRDPGRPRLARPLDRAAALVDRLVERAPAPPAARPQDIPARRQRPTPLHPELTNHPLVTRRFTGQTALHPGRPAAPPRTAGFPSVHETKIVRWINRQFSLARRAKSSS